VRSEPRKSFECSQNYALEVEDLIMAKTPATSAADFLPGCTNLKALRAAATFCEGCELFERATQTVFGRGPRHADLVLVGEMPGDQEDLQGKPFVGPAGRLLRDMLDEANIASDDVYLTNVVKHFRWEERGKRRLHKKPASRHIEACKPWLEAELFVIRPQLIVCLGATAAQALLGKEFRLTREHGKVFQNSHAQSIAATFHPSAILRAPDESRRHQMRETFVDDVVQALRQTSLLNK
jgi:uracil-DNA glycosylase